MYVYILFVRPLSDRGWLKIHIHSSTIDLAPSEMQRRLFVVNAADHLWCRGEGIVTHRNYQSPTFLSLFMWLNEDHFIFSSRSLELVNMRYLFIATFLHSTVIISLCGWVKSHLTLSYPPPPILGTGTHKEEGQRLLFPCSDLVILTTPHHTIPRKYSPTT